MLRYIVRGIKYKSKEIILTLYNTVVRPHFYSLGWLCWPLDTPGGKPKALVSSNPDQREPWIAARTGKHGGKLPFCPHPTHALQLTNNNKTKE